MMHGRGKSSPVIVAMKPVNKAARSATEPSVKEPAAAESVEPRAGAKGNADWQSTCRTQSRVSVSQALERIRQVGSRLLCRSYPRWEPYAGKPQVRVCAGGARQLVSLPRLRSRDFLTLLGGVVAWPLAARARPADGRAATLLSRTASSTADTLAQIINDLIGRIGSTVQLSWSEDTMAQRRSDALRLLRQAIPVPVRAQPGLAQGEESGQPGGAAAG
jgi:hypothetical protein